MCPSKDYGCGVLPPWDCPDLPPYRSFDCMKVECDLFDVVSTTTTTTTTTTSSSSNLDAASVDKGSHWAFFFGGFLFTGLCVILAIFLYWKFCRQPRVSARPNFFHVNRPLERRRKEKVLASVEKEEEEEEVAPPRVYPKSRTPQMSLGFFSEGDLSTGYFDRGSEELPRYSPSAPPAETPELPSPPSSPPSYESEQDVARLDPDSLAAAINLAQKKEIRVN